MTTRILAGGNSPNVHVNQTAPRTTAPPSRPFDQVMRAGADAIVGSAESVVSKLPGGSILVAATRTPPDTSGSAVSPTGPSTAPEVATGTASGPLAASSGGPSIERVLDQNADQNLYFLGLQERISQENRQFTAVSNVLKARHETVKNAIGNIR